MHWEALCPIYVCDEPPPPLHRSSFTQYSVVLPIRSMLSFGPTYLCMLLTLSQMII
jgi:hypothetical protein